MSVANWFIEGYFNAGTFSRMPVSRFPFQIGRQPGIGLTLGHHSVSRIHAQLSLVDGALWLTDNHSTNGTFVNRQRLSEPTPLSHGDVLHFGEFEVRLVCEMERTQMGFDQDDRTIMASGPLTNMIPEGVRQLQELLDNGWIVPAFQPIVDARTEAVHAYELLGRGLHPALSKSPGHLFRVAESMPGMALALSRLFREKGVAAAAAFQSEARFFVNLHPLEVASPATVASLVQHMGELRGRYPTLKLVLEIHEKAASDIGTMRRLRSAMDGLGIELAYDDFGAGQARLLELIEAPSHYLKFDMGLLHNIDKAPAAQQDMVHMLVAMTRKMGICTLAEGLESAEEVQVCKAMGFDFIQGFFYGRPTEGTL